jgi:Phage gp6-like head-tail connector protein
MGAGTLSLMSTYITLAQAKAQLRIDASLTVDDDQIRDMIGAAVDWAENYTNRSLGELLELNSPQDSIAVPVPDPTWPEGRPSRSHVWDIDCNDWVDTAFWDPGDYRAWWARFPQTERDDALPLRRDVKQAILIYIETLYDRNIENIAIYESKAKDMLWPYRRALGV